MEVAQAAARCLEAKVWMEAQVKRDQLEVSLVPCGGAVEFWEKLQEEEEEVVLALWTKTSYEAHNQAPSMFT